MPGDSYNVVGNHSFKAIWTTEKGKDGTALGEGASAVAKVSASGKVKAVKKGSAKIVVYAQNGVFKSIKIKVK